MNDILNKMRTAAEGMKKADDNLLRAIAMIAATGSVTVIPNDIGWSKPVIHLPQQMYDRLLEIMREPYPGLFPPIPATEGKTE